MVAENSSYRPTKSTDEHPAMGRNSKPFEASVRSIPTEPLATV